MELQRVILVQYLHSLIKAGCGIVIYDNENVIVGKWAVHTGFTTNNRAEYFGAIYGMKLCSDNGIKKIKVLGDSELVIKQLTGIYKVKKPHLIPMHAEAIILSKLFDEVSFHHISREINEEADKLANEGVLKYGKIKQLELKSL